MDAKDFRDFGKASIDYIANYIETLRDRDVLPSVEPGYLSELLPQEAPEKPEAWQDVLRDVERVIMPGVTHWASPNFHAYYPSANSYPALIGDIFSAGFGCIGFSWMSSPACTELEVITANWLGKLMDLPEEFLNCSEGPGGGVIQGSASEATFVCLLAAKQKTAERLANEHPDWSVAEINSKLVAYTSDQANSSVEKAGLLGSIKMRQLPTDEDCRLRGSTVLAAMKADEEAGLVPFYVVATFGTTGTCAFDRVDEIGPICNEKKVWLHIDAAYAGAALACPEFRHLMPGIGFSDSFNFNPHKWMLVNFDCSVLWVKDSNCLINAFNVERIYLSHDKQGQAPDYRHWQIPLGRRFRSLKLWFVLRLYGIEGIQNFIRGHVNLAQYFEQLVRTDDRFEVVTQTLMGLVCFRIKGDNALTKELLDRLTERKKIYVIAATYREKLIIRFVVCSRQTERRDIDFAWNEITSQTSVILQRISENVNETEVEKELEVYTKDPSNMAGKIENLTMTNDLTKSMQ